MSAVQSRIGSIFFHWARATQAVQSSGLSRIPYSSRYVFFQLKQKRNHQKLCVCMKERSFQILSFKAAYKGKIVVI